MKSDARPISSPDQPHSGQPPWSLVRAVFEAAVVLDGVERERLLSAECGANLELRREVDTLLADHEESDGFLEKPVASVQSLLEGELPVTEPDDYQIGARVGAYRLEKEIGRGGMGAVYLATRADSEFDKQVAIKLIREGAVSESAIRRFRHERQILARLENAYIARLIDGGTTTNGAPYFVMEYVEGQTVLQYCETNSLTTRDRLNLFLKICSAVQYAHERSIIHRDLKPGNILVKRDGTPKLLDFGIAKMLGVDGGAEQDNTLQGFRMLTPAYASPEQMRGDTPTVKSDVYALGVVLYELLCGRRPDTQVYQRAAGAVAPHEAHLSGQLRSIALQAIHLDPDERYATVDTFTADIRRYLGGAPPLSNSPESMGSPPSVSLAILPFRMLGSQVGDKAFLASGIAEALITKLSRIDRLSIPPSSAVRKYTDGVEAVRAARELHVRYVLEGSIHTAGESVRANVQLVFAEAGIAVWASQIDASEKDLLVLEDSIAEQVASAVVPHLTGEERAEISRSGTSSGAAHAAYLRGRWLWGISAGDQSKLAQALVCFMEAIAIDPGFARAHAGVADYYLRLGLWGGLPPSESFAAAIDSARKAVDLEPTLGEAHASLAFAIWAYHRDEELAEKHFTLATARNPNYASAHHWFGLLNSARNRPELAIANLERAQQVDPNSAVIAAALGFVHYNARNYETALRLLTEAAHELPKSAVMHEMLAWTYLQTGQVEPALGTARLAVEYGNRGSAALSALARAEAAAGNLNKATQLRQEIEDAARKQHVSSYDRASAALAAGQPQQALAQLEQALEDRDWWLSWIGVDPRWDPLRQETRFKRLLQNGRARRREWRVTALAVLSSLAILAGLGGWWASRPKPTPFANAKFTKLTTNGIADSSSISPDGRYVVYSAMDAGGTSIWRRRMDTGQVTRLTPRMAGKVSDLGFTDGGAVVQFVSYPVKDPNNRHLYTVPIGGGRAISVPGEFTGPVTISPDGRLAASFISNPGAGNDELWISNLRTGERRLLTYYRYPRRFAATCSPAWSSDGSMIAYAAEDKDNLGFLIRLYAIEVKTGAAHLIGSPRWQWVQGVSWTGDASGVTVVGQEHESSFQQIWYVPYPTAEERVRRVGNDLDDYLGARVTADSSELVSVQSQTLSNIYLAKAGNLAHPSQITTGSGRYFDLSWMPDGHILYASDATGSADLWMMNVDGSDEHPLISGNRRNYAPVAAPDSRSIAFHSNRSGNWQVWSTDVSGGNPRQLSPGQGDGNWPQFTPDGKFVLFHRTGTEGVFNIWRVPAAGGPAVQLIPALTMHPAVSRVDGKIACWYSEKIDTPHWKIAVFGPEGGAPLQVFNPTADAKPDTTLRWTPKADAITFMDYAKSVSNIWLQPVDGRPAHPLTFFDSGDIYSFDWSRDGTLIYSRGLTTSDVVLVRDLNAAKERP